MSQTTSHSDQVSPAADTRQRRNRRSRQLTGTHFIFAAIIAIGLALAINFSNRIIADRELREIEAAVENEIDLLQGEQQDLLQRLDYVRGDAFVEDWARSEGKMIREGEVLVIPVPAAQNATPVPLIEDMPDMQTAPPEPETWELWWALFFDTPPPGGL